MNEFIEISGTKCEIEANSKGDKIRIKVENVHIKDSDVIDWGNLAKSLRFANFRKCVIDSLNCFQKLENLEELYFRECLFNGSLDIEKYVKLYNFKVNNSTFSNESLIRLNNQHLRAIEIYRLRGFTNMKFLGDLPKLTHLVISHTTLDEINNLEKTMTLKFLNLEDNKITKLDGIEEIIKQNPQLKTIKLIKNPLKEAKEIDGILKWELSGSKFYPRKQIDSIRISIPVINVPPKPKPKPIYETYEISERATTCKYCGKTIPPLSDFFVDHCKLSISIYSSEKSLVTEEKCYGRKDDITSTLFVQHFYFKTINLQGLRIPKLNGPLCKTCSVNFRQKARNILGGLKTRVFVKELYKSRDSLQRKFDRMRKKWSKKEAQIK